MNCPKCGEKVEYQISCHDGVFIDKNGKMFVDRDGELMDWVTIYCSKEKCDWSEAKDISKETVKQIALEAGLIEEPTVISKILKDTLESLHKQN